MKSFSTFLLPVILAIAAGVLNYLSLRGSVKDYAVASESIPLGEKIADSNLKKMQVRGAIHGGIEWDNRAVLFDMPAPRSIEKDEYLLLQDIRPDVSPSIDLVSGEVAINLSLAGVEFEDKLVRVGENVGFVIRRAENPSKEASARPDYEIVGPKRVVTLGTQVSDEEDANSVRSDRPSTLSIAAKELDPDVKRLLEANEQRRIAAVVFYKKETAAPTEKKAAEADEKSVQSSK